MYDSFISPAKYNELKDKVDKWINDNGSYDEYDTLMNEIEAAYDSGEISSSSYDELTRILEDYQ